MSPAASYEYTGVPGMGIPENQAISAKADMIGRPSLIQRP